jgi:hypothetical protein
MEGMPLQDDVNRARLAWREELIPERDTRAVVQDYHLVRETGEARLGGRAKMSKIRAKYRDASRLKNPDRVSRGHVNPSGMLAFSWAATE